MSNIITKIITAVLFMTLLAACGGEGGTAPSTTKSVRFSTVGTTAQQIYGIQLVATLPQGVTVETEANGSIADGIVTLYGSAVGSLIDAMYDSTATPASLRIALTKETPLGIGDFVTVKFSVAPGVSLTARDITFSQFVAKDGNGATVSGINGNVSFVQ